MKKVLFIWLFLSCFSASASHIIGGDIYYDYLGANQYKFYLTLYRDCNSSGAQFDNPLYLSVYTQNGTPATSYSLFQNLTVSFPGSTGLPIQFNNPCATPPTNICAEKAVYETVINLPPIPGGYTVTYQRCCRGPNVTNIVQPDDTGLTLSTHVPGVATGFTNNSSPRFTNYPPILLCNNDNLFFDHAAVDPDGDDLVYSLVTPNSGATGINPAPNPAPPPPYQPVIWSGAFNAASPLGPGSVTTIDPSTGVLNVIPNMLGLFVVGVRVEEYRNGTLVGETVRDFLFRVFDCNIVMQAILPAYEQLPTFVSYCQGLTVDFVNNSFGGTNYLWDFGDGNSSTAFAPTHTYASPGTYQVALVVNPGWNCTDTAFMTVIVNNPFSVSWTSQDSLCIVDNSFDFAVQTNINNANFDWTFDNTSSVPTANGIQIPGVTFSTPGYHVITVSGDNLDCQTDYTDSVFIFDIPIAEIELPPEIQCEGLSIPFGNNSVGAINYFWDFGVAGITTDISTINEPSYLYPTSGNYTVTLIASSSPSCADTAVVNIDVNEDLILSFTHSDSLCIVNNSYDFVGSASGPPNLSFEWDFGPLATPSSASHLNVSNVVYQQAGLFTVQLKAMYDICSDSVTSTVFVYAEPQVDFAYANSLQCAPSTASFINMSSSDTPPSYFWDFGDGGSSTLENPSHVYNDIGNYSVGLTMITHVGCIDTLYLMQQDIVTVYPSPEAGFIVTPDQTDICDSEVEFIDQSFGSSEYFYVFDHYNFSSTQANFSHEYTLAGSDYPIQVVTNEYGCQDTARQEVFIEPFTIYVPNAFVPDGDAVNELFGPITSFEIVEWDFQIYNRFGELIFQTDDFNHFWDGNYKGKKCQDGVYAYVLKYKSCANPHNFKMLTGHVNLLR